MKLYPVQVIALDFTLNLGKQRSPLPSRHFLVQKCGDSLLPLRYGLLSEWNRHCAQGTIGKGMIPCITQPMELRSEWLIVHTCQIVTFQMYLFSALIQWNKQRDNLLNVTQKNSTVFVASFTVYVMVVLKYFRYSDRATVTTAYFVI